MRVLNLSGFLGAALLSSAIVDTAQSATFDAGTVNFQYYFSGGTFNSDGSPSTFSAPGSATFGPWFTVTVSGDQIVYTYLEATNWSGSTASLNSNGLFIDNGSLISSVSGIPSFTNVTLDPSSILTGSTFTASDVTWNSGAVAVSWGGTP